MQELKEIIYKYIKRYGTLVEDGAMTLGGLHKLMQSEGVTCSRNYVYYLHKKYKDEKSKSGGPGKGKAKKRRKNN